MDKADIKKCENTDIKPEDEPEDEIKIGGRLNTHFDCLISDRLLLKLKQLHTRTLLENLVFFALYGAMSVIFTVILFRKTGPWQLLPVAVIAGAIFYTISLFFDFRNNMRIFLWISGPVFSLIITETLVGNIKISPLVIKLTYNQAILNIIWYYIPAVVLFFVTGRLNLSSGISTVLGFVWGNLNYYLLQFRGRILFPADLTAIGTALRVQSGYDWSFNAEQWVFCGVLAVYLAALITTRPRKDAKRPGVFISVSAIAACAVYIYVFFGTSFIKNMGIKPSLWYTQQNGVLLNFMVNLDFSHTSPPPGYAPEVINGLIDSTEAPVNGKKPDIIVVMNEAFSDIGVLGEFETNTDYMPFFRSIKENTIKGYAYSSVYGGNTANSEFEFLTGNTMAFLPAGTVAYQLYASAGDYTLTGQLGGLGYTAIAIHPYEDYCWNRQSVYEYYGFKDTYFIDDYEKTGYVRYYIGDKYNYQKLISVYEEYKDREPETPLFFFNVTMQNHGSYYQDWVNLNRTVYLTGKNKEKYPDLDQYLSLIKESDEALETLIDYFKKVDNPTIIMFFGDHQPSLDSEFYESIFGKPVEELTVSEREKLHMVPFMLWANYDIEEQDGVEASLNYLSLLLLEAAQLPKTAYQEFLTALWEKIPVINAVGYLEAGREFTDNITVLSKDAQNLIGKYKIAQYNGIFDKINMVKDFFFLKQEN
jgi:hypothetical protein